MTRNVFSIALTVMAAAGLFLAGQAAAFAEKRVALVIGNSKYVHASELKNPANDARAMADALTSLSFNVIKGVDLDENGMRSAINEFARSIADAQVALLFYAGHGLQVDGQNYLLPINAELNNEIDLQFQGVSIEFLLRVMENRNRTSIVLLDACRNNPLAARLARSMASARGRTIAPGLARIESGVGTYIGFSTSPNSVALDGDGENSPFTTALVKHIETEDVDIEAVMRNVREDVIQATNGSQVPWGNSSLVGRGFVFKAASATPTENPATEETKSSTPTQTEITTLLENIAVGNNQARSAADKQVEATFWNSIKDSSDARFFQAYLEEYPEGVFSGLAKLKIAMLEGQRAPKQPESDEKTATEQGAGPAAVENGDRNLEIANLSQEKPATADEAEPEEMTRDQIETLQVELNRVGCSVGRADGIWGRRSQSALEEFVRRAKVEVASVEPTSDFIEQLKSFDEDICPPPPVRKKTVTPRTTRRTAKKTVTIIRQPAQRRTTTRVNPIQNNRHMPPGVDSDGAQM